MKCASLHMLQDRTLALAACSARDLPVLLWPAEDDPTSDAAAAAGAIASNSRILPSKKLASVAHGTGWLSLEAFSQSRREAASSFDAVRCTSQSSQYSTGCPRLPNDVRILAVWLKTRFSSDADSFAILGIACNSERVDEQSTIVVPLAEPHPSGIEIEGSYSEVLYQPFRFPRYTLLEVVIYIVHFLHTRQGAVVPNK